MLVTLKIESFEKTYILYLYATLMQHNLFKKPKYRTLYNRDVLEILLI